MSEKKSTVLVVDDQKISRKMLNKMLSDDYSIIEAENGEEALAIVKEHGFSISAVLLDIVMPVMNGYDFLKEISKLDFKNIPIIAMTGDLHVGHEEQALEMGAWDFISKPYTPGILISRLKSAIARSKMASYEQLKKLVEIDTLTGIYNKNKFF